MTGNELVIRSGSANLMTKRPTKVDLTKKWYKTVSSRKTIHNFCVCGRVCVCVWRMDRSSNFNGPSVTVTVMLAALALFGVVCRPIAAHPLEAARSSTNSGRDINDNVVSYRMPLLLHFVISLENVINTALSARITRNEVLLIFFFPPCEQNSLSDCEWIKMKGNSQNPKVIDRLRESSTGPKARHFDLITSAAKGIPGSVKEGTVYEPLLRPLLYTL